MLFERHIPIKLSLGNLESFTLFPRVKIYGFELGDEWGGEGKELL